MKKHPGSAAKVSNSCQRERGPLLYDRTDPYKQQELPEMPRAPPLGELASEARRRGH